MFHPTRGGTRGGRDQFNWEDVKEDKHRENYLGHSLMAPIGRWQKGKDLTWYAKESKDDTKAKANMLEIAKIKEAEAEAMAIALGVKKKKTLESKVTEDELKRALTRGNEDSDDEKSNVETEKGLGYGKSSRFPIADQQQNSSVEVINAENRTAIHSNYKNDENEEEHEEKKKSRKHHKHHKSDKSKKRHRKYSSDSEDDSSSKRRHRSDREGRHHESSHRRRERDDSRRRSRSPSRRSGRRENKGSERGRSSNYSRKSTYEDDRRSLSPYSKRAQLSKK